MRLIKDNVCKSYKITDSQAKELIDYIKTAIEKDQKKIQKIIESAIANVLYMEKEDN